MFQRFTWRAAWRIWPLLTLGLIGLGLVACGGQSLSETEIEAIAQRAARTAVAEAMATYTAQQPRAQADAAAPAQPTAKAATPEAAQGPQRVEVSVDDDPAWGPEDAAVTIIEFSDFQCPYCARFRRQTYDRLKETYGDKIRFVYRDFPLVQIHPQAVPAALAAQCALEQGKYWEYHDLLFLGDKPLNRDTFVAYADQLGLDVDEFSRCLDEERYLSEIQKDFDDGVAAGVRGTPTFFINGIPLVGAQPFENFQAIIEQELARAGQD